MLMRPIALRAPFCLGALLLASIARAGEEQATPGVRSNAGTAIPSAPARESERSVKLPPIGVNLSVFVPSSGRVRDGFGGTWFGISPGFGHPAPRTRHAIQPSLDLLHRKHGGNELLILQAGAKYLHVLGGRLESEVADRGGSRFVPYIGAKVYLTWARLDTESTSRSTHWFPAGTALVGAGLGSGFFTEARYRYFPRVNGYDFSGTELELGYRYGR